MSNLRISVLCVVLALVAPDAIEAACGGAWPIRNQVLEIQIDSCQAPETFAAEAAECVSAKWLLRMQEEAVKNAEGWVIRGIVEQVQELATYEDGTKLLSAPSQADVPGVWFVPTSSHDPASFSCPSAQGQVLQFVVRSPCCDSVPPGDFSCWFELKNLGLVSEKLKTELGYR